MEKYSVEDMYEAYGGIPREYRAQLEEYFNTSPGPSAWKLQNFAKYVPRQSITRLLGKNEIFQHILNIHGSIVECGVFAGGSLMTWAQLSAIFEPLNTTRRIIGFDTFSGFPELNKEDTETARNNPLIYKGAWGLDTYKDIQKSIELYNKNRLFKSPIDKVVLVKGDICQTLPKYIKDNPGTIIALLYLDADLYGPTKTALECCVSRMPKGAVIVFDELGCETYPGETIATLETIGVKDLKIRRFTYDTHISYAILGE